MLGIDVADPQAVMLPGIFPGHLAGEDRRQRLPRLRIDQGQEQVQDQEWDGGDEARQVDDPGRQRPGTRIMNKPDALNPVSTVATTSRWSF